MLPGVPSREGSAYDKERIAYAASIPQVTSRPLETKRPMKRQSESMGWPV